MRFGCFIETATREKSFKCAYIQLSLCGSTVQLAAGITPSNLGEFEPLPSTRLAQSKCNVAAILTEVPCLVGEGTSNFRKWSLPTRLEPEWGIQSPALLTTQFLMLSGSGSTWTIPKFRPWGSRRSGLRLSSWCLWKIYPTPHQPVLPTLAIPITVRPGTLASWLGEAAPKPNTSPSSLSTVLWVPATQCLCTERLS